jgi:outer membrane protein OmpA-like peptidoglycan-associated protein
MLNLQRVTLVVVAGLILLPTASHAQKIRTFSGTPTAQELIDVLKPKNPRRGVAPEGATCEVFRQPEVKKRGVGLTETTLPESEQPPDIAALHVTFAFNSAEISTQAKPTLEAMAEALNSKELQGNCIQIEGHTDNKGTDEYNQKLSRRRAESVVAYLTQQLKVDQRYLFPVGKGEAYPIATNDSDEGREQNRRVQLMNRGYPTNSKAQSEDDGWGDKR